MDLPPVVADAYHLFQDLIQLVNADQPIWLQVITVVYVYYECVGVLFIWLNRTLFSVFMSRLSSGQFQYYETGVKNFNIAYCNYKIQK